METLIAIAFAVTVTAALGWLIWRTADLGRTRTRIAFFEGELDRQGERCRELGTVVKRHIQQSLDSRQQVRQLQRQLESLRRQTLEGQGFDNAIACVRKGRDIKPMVSRGELSPAEAHLIRLVHSSQPEKAQQRPALRN